MRESVCVLLLCCAIKTVVVAVVSFLRVYIHHIAIIKSRLFGLGKTIGETLSSKRKFTQFMSNHLLSDMNW